MSAVIVTKWIGRCDFCFAAFDVAADVHSVACHSVAIALCYKAWKIENKWHSTINFPVICLAILWTSLISIYLMADISHYYLTPSLEFDNL